MANARPILDALMESGQFTPEMLEALRGGDDEEGQAKLAKLLDELVQRLIQEGRIGEKAGAKLPGIYFVNWFRKDRNGKFV